VTPYRTLLCPIDFSDASRLAVEWCVGFAKDVDAELVLLHVLDTPHLAVGNLVAVPDLVPELRKRADEELARWRQEIDLSRARVETQEGAPDDTILAAASRLGVDLVVMGTHGLSGFQKLFLGSVTERVLHQLHVPLLTLSSGGREQERAGFSPPRTIVIGIDFGEEASSVIRHGLWLAEHYQAELVAVHAVPVPYVVLNDQTLERLGPDELIRLEHDLTADRRAQIADLLPESMSTEVRIVAKVGAPFDVLRGVVRERRADLVVLGAGGHGEASVRWLGSTCHKMVRSSARPVLIVR
jgi:nucleotide-binding universal stress UspA family protein